jgi:beta-galactosidase/beta-glucuronidase
MRFIVFLIWSALLFADAPRSEFPQPQFERAQWMSLNGMWEFEFDDHAAGLGANWAAGAHKFNRSITVPFAFETKLSGIGDTSFHPQIWYRKSFTVPADWRGRHVLLHFGAVDYRARVWINGTTVGGHEGGNVPFWFDVTPHLKAGANTVTVWAEDPPTDRFIPRGKQYWELKSRSIFYTRTSGIWQPVWLEATGESYLDRVRITPSVDGTVKFESLIVNPAANLTLTATVAGTTATVPATAAHTNAAIAIANPRFWSVESPQLYDVVFELHRGAEVLDRVSSYFGIRSISVGSTRVILNGRPTYLRFVLDQGYWPESTLTPPSDEAMQYDIKTAKAMGFNGARKHQKLADPRYLYWADKLGFLVSSEMAHAYEFDEGYVERFTREWLEAVQRDYNHPSIVIWNPINESWGVPNLRDPRQQNHLRAMYTATKSLDSTRLVIDNEGWEHTEMTDLFAIHDYARTGELLYDKYKDARISGVIPDNGRPALAPGNKYNGSPLYLSEFGGIAYILPGSPVPAEAWGYSGVEKTREAALERIAGLWKAIAKLPFAGICYTQLTDVEQEINGLMSYDRKPKYPVEQIKALNDLLR